MGEHKLNISRRTFLGGAAAFGVISLTANPLVAFATPSSAEKQAEADEVRVKVEALQAELVDKSNAYGAALDEQDQALAAMESAQVQIDETNTKIADLQDKLGTRARSMYRSGGSSFLDILFGATSFTEFATNWDMLNKMNEDDAALVDEAKTLREELDDAYEEFTAQEELAAAKAEEARLAKEDTESAASHYQVLLDSLDAETRELLAQEQEAAAIAAAAAAAANQQSDSNNGGNGNGGSSGGDTSGGNTGSNGGGSAADFGPPAGDILSEASKYLGMDYIWGSHDPSRGGFDCSGLVYYCCMRCGRNIPPRSTYGYPSSGWFPVSEAQPGDILWQPNHVGICASPGGGSYIHAADETYGICYGSSPQFQRAYRY